MARPTKGYRNAEGKRVPGTTSVEESVTGLLIWSNRLGLEGIAYRDHMEEVTTIGTLIHDCIECVLDGKDPEALLADANPEWRESILGGLAAFERWYKRNRLTIVEKEFPLVSERYQFGGTPDGLAECDGVHRLEDWKSGPLRAKHLLQMGAYDRLIQECMGITVEGADVVRFDRGTGTFTHMELDRTALEIGWEAFECSLKKYRAMQKVRRYAK